MIDKGRYQSLKGQGRVLIQSLHDVEDRIAGIREATKQTMDWLLLQQADPLVSLRRMKFEAVGRHPVDGHELNFIEQVNQTWTYLAALAATRELLRLHPDASGFRLAPGARASQPLDVT